MSKGKEETYKKLIDSARMEFKEKTYQGASIRSISSRAGMTIGALYQHFDSKEAVFEEVVASVYQGFFELAEMNKENFRQTLKEEDEKLILVQLAKTTESFLSYIFEHWDLFSLLIKNQETNIYQEFFQKVVENDLEMTELLLARIYHKEESKIDFDQMRVVVAAQYTGIFSLMASDIELEKMKEQLNILFAFFSYGWEGLIKNELA